jgi:replicative DNA helicase
MITDKPPYMPDAQAEESLLLGCILTHPKAMPTAVASGVDTLWFTTAEHQAIWETTKRIYESAEEADDISVMLDLRRQREQGKTTIDPECVKTLNASGTMLSHYIDVIRTKHLQRKAIRNAKMLVENLERPIPSVDGIKEAIEEPLNEFARLSLSDGLVTDADRIKELVERKEREREGVEEAVPKEFMVHLGMPSLEEAFGRIDRRSADNMIVIGAPSSRGKSALMRQILNWNIAEHPQWVMCGFLLESAKEDFWHISACSSAAINTRINLKHITKEQWDVYHAALKAFKSRADRTVFLFDGNASVETIEARCREVKARQGRLDLIMVDYIQIVQRPRRNNTEAEVADISRGLKQIQKQFACPLFSGTQLNEDGKTRESRAVFNDATRVWVMDRPDVDRNGVSQVGEFDRYEQTIEQQKFRNGALCRRHVMFDVARQRIFSENENVSNKSIDI